MSNNNGVSPGNHDAVEFNGMDVDDAGQEMDIDDAIQDFLDDMNDDDDEHEDESDEGEGGDEQEEFLDLSSESAYSEEEDDYDENFDFQEALRGAGNFRQKNKRKTARSKSYWKQKMMRSSNRSLDPEVRSNLSQANEAFVRKDYQVAQNLYLEVIKLDPKNFNAYKTLGEICKLQGRLAKCCNYWFLAANIHSWDSGFWAQVAELSNDLGLIDQAIYCYGKAIAADNTKNPKYILARAILYKEKRQFGRALEGFQRLHQMFPADTTVVKNLASVYVDQKRLNDAINLYGDILDRNMSEGSSNELGRFPRFGWAELNILTELYIQQHSWRHGLKIIKVVARWLQNREDETWWEDHDDDSEFDSQRRTRILDQLSQPIKARASKKQFQIPIDIRFKMGLLRLSLNQKDEAMHHFEFLLEDSDDIVDLFFEAGKVLESQGYYEDALVFLTRASQSDELSQSAELVSLCGKCFLEVGDYQQASRAYQALLYGDPDNLEFKLSLAEALYHLGDAENSAHLLQEVSNTRAKSSDLMSDMLEDDDEEPEEEEHPDELSIIKTKHMIKSNKKLSNQEKEEIENKARRRVLEKYGRMKRLEDSLKKNDKVAISAWMQLAFQLVEMFMAVRSFFPKDKNRIFKGVLLYRRIKPMGIDEKLARVYNLHQGMTEEENNNRNAFSSTTEYRGLTYDIWFSIFVQYALLLANFEGNLAYASQIIEAAQEASIFSQDKFRDSVLKAVRLMFGIMGEESLTSVVTHIRHFLANNQFSRYIYIFFMCCFPSGLGNWETFTNYNHQKYFLRQLKAYDSLLTSTKITGMATITAKIDDYQFTKEPCELLYIYANLLGGSRSYVSSTVYLSRAYKLYNRDPMICLVIGLSHVHRAMQRLSTNRHIQLLQGISYILEYKEHRLLSATVYEETEVEYNLGRLFHMLGLPTLAIRHYEKVLMLLELIEDPTFDLLMDAAYNLTLIYNVNGNSRKARAIMEKYLTI